ncbi:MAG TPA: CU044_2847 family protein [Pseudonocardiaceae bacterium]|nr:CU044_2847 family protein [Pseudonocardiaceae bacterium]
MTVLVEVPVDDGSVLVVEADRADIPGGLTLASPEPGAVAARAVRSLSDSLGRLEPLLRAVKEQLVASNPDRFAVEFGVKLGGETGIILAKGTAEVNLKITMTWDRAAR